MSNVSVSSLCPLTYLKNIVQTFSAQVTCGRGTRGSVPLMIVKCYVLPVFWTMSCFHLTGHMCIVRLMEKVCQSAGGNADGAELQADAAELSALPPAD